MEFQEIVISPEQSNNRLDIIIAENLFISRNKAQKHIDSGKVLSINNLVINSSKKVKAGEIYRVRPFIESENILLPHIQDLKIIFEDEDLLIINKPSNLTVHPGAGNYQDTLANILLYYLKGNFSDINGPLRPGILHRLDKDTTGAMIIAKNNDAHLILADQLKKRQLKRYYLSVNYGNVIPKEASIKVNMGRSKSNYQKMSIYKIGGKESISHYKLLKNYGQIASLLQFKLETGRTHQIRLHSEFMGFPLIGDKLYNKNFQFRAKIFEQFDRSIIDYIKNFPRQALHSEFIEFYHPRNANLMRFSAELPDDIRSLIEILEKYNDNI